MNIFLKHPRHGSKIAIMEAEALHDEEIGWVRYNPNEPCAQASEPVNVLATKRKGPKKATEQGD